MWAPYLIKTENDAKIDNLAALMEHNQTRNETNLRNELEQNNKVLLNQLTQLMKAPPSNPPNNPPGDSVEHSSRDGGSQN